jgi:SAM-dependent methyltransferase
VGSHLTREQIFIERLHALRSSELKSTFAACPPRVFCHGLELGAGDGYQSRLLTHWIESLVSTDYATSALPPHDEERITYMQCDAEQLGNTFPPRSFDIIFSSNMMEHLPDPHHALAGIHTVLNDNGITIHILPNVLWKATQVALYPLGRLYSSLSRDGLLKRFQRMMRTSPRITQRDLPERMSLPTNNPKTSRPARHYLMTWLIPEPHGVSRTNREEFHALSQKRWIDEFNHAGFDVVVIRRGPVASGYAFGLDRLRGWLERLGLASHTIYVAKKSGHNSDFVRYFVA